MQATTRIVSQVFAYIFLQEKTANTYRRSGLPVS
jgi:hypothetical protein